jgi:endogenous inhibitor of DNA gyrase (YacG/DUF329 family)
VGLRPTAALAWEIMGEFSLSVEFSIDDDGFLRRECPNCERQFKWHQGDHGEPEPRGGYFCPYCQKQSDGAWLTPVQARVVDYAVTKEVIEPALDDFGNSLKGIERASGGFLKVSIKEDVAEPPSIPDEPNDMVRVDFTCHPSESIKVGEEWTDLVHCLICGSASPS